jgi:hypothetical protein
MTDAAMLRQILDMLWIQRQPATANAERTRVEIFSA